jgi:hypothetical protein
MGTAIFTPTNSKVILDIPKKYVGKKIAITYFLTSDIVEQQDELPQELKKRIDKGLSEIKKGETTRYTDSAYRKALGL